MRKNIVAWLISWLWLSGVAGASTISGVVVNANTNFPIPWAYAQLHRLNPETGYLEFVINGATAKDGSFVFEAEKEGNYLLEVSADSYLLSRSDIFLADDWDTTGLLITLTPSPAAISCQPSLVFDGDMVVDYQVKNTTASPLLVDVSLTASAPADTDFQTLFQAGPWPMLIRPFYIGTARQQVSVSPNIPKGYAVCGWLQVMAPGNPFMVYDKFYLCTPPKGSVLPTSPPAPPKG